MNQHPRKQVRLAVVQKEEIRSLYLSGMPPHEIINRFGCSKGNFTIVVRGLRPLRRKHLHDNFLARLEAIPAITKGWVAGIVDGEGHIGISRTTGSAGMTPRLQVSSATKVMQDTLHGLLGGHVYRITRPSHERTQFMWTLWSTDALRAFFQIFSPLLIVKRDVAVVVERFCKRRAAGVINKKKDTRDWEMAASLNKKGC